LDTEICRFPPLRQKRVAGMGTWHSFYGCAMRKKLGWAIGGVFLIILIWRLTCPTLIRLGSVMPGGTRMVINPLRTSAPRRAAESLLELLRAGNVAGVHQEFPLIDQQEVLDYSIDPPTRWTLSDIVEDPDGGLDFEYLNSTSAAPEGGYIWIYCVRDIRGAWTVAKFNRVY